MKKKGFIAFIKVYAVTAIIGILILQFPFIRSFLQRAELFFNDLHFKVKDYDKKKIDDIIIIDIDEKSINKLGRFSSWPLKYFGDVVSIAKQSGARYIIFDIFFTEHDKLSNKIVTLYTNKLKTKFKVDSLTLNNIISSLDTEEDFADSLKAAGNVTLAAFDDFNVTEFNEVDLPINITQFNKNSFSFLPKFKEINSPTLPITTLAESAYKIGLAHISPDDDGTTRHFDTFFIYGDKLLINFSMQCIIDALAVDSVNFVPQSVKLFSKGKNVLNIPVNENGQTPLNFYGPKKQFRYISFSNVLQRRIPEDILKNKIVLIGSSAIGLRDLKTIPIDDNYPGTELHATFIKNALTDNFIHKVSNYFIYLEWLVLLLICMAIFWRLNIIYNLSLLPIIIFIILIVAHVLFEQYNLLIAQSYLIVSLLFGFLSVLIYKYQTEFKERQKIKKTFEKYVSTAIIDEMLEHPEKLKLGGEVRNVTALFTDIQNFTTISEKISPSELTEFLKKYMTELTQIVYEKGGMLDKYIGDAIVALFGVPINLENHPVAACECVLMMRNLSRKIIAEFPNDAFRGVRTRFGLNTGNMICGNMGSEQLFDYTGIGDNMNLAARLEGINKLYGTEIIISEFTKNKLTDDFIVRELDKVAVKGKSEGVTIYELIDKRDKIDNLDVLLNNISIYEDTIKKYYAGNWEEALAGMKKYLEIVPSDQAAQTILKRIEHYKVNPPKDWDGVCKLEIK